MKTINFFLFVLLLFTHYVIAGINDVSYNVDVDYESDDGQIRLHNHVMREDFFGLTQNHTPANIANLRSAHIIGYHKDADGFNYFLFDAGFRLNGATVIGNDIIKCNNAPCTSHSYYLIGNDPTIKHIRINAFMLDPVNGDIIFSIDSAESINGQLYFPADLIRLNRATGSYSLEFDSLLTSVSSNIIGPTRNIDAVSSYLLSPNIYIISFASDGQFNSFSYTKSDVLLLNISGSNSISKPFVPSPAHFGAHNYNVNITSLMDETPALSDVIFDDGFE